MAVEQINTQAGNYSDLDDVQTKRKSPKDCLLTALAVFLGVGAGTFSLLLVASAVR